MKCPKQLADGKTILHSEKWKQGGTTEPMRRHVMKHHREVVEGSEQLAPKTASQPLRRTVSACPGSFAAGKKRKAGCCYSTVQNDSLCR